MYGVKVQIHRKVELYLCYYTLFVIHCFPPLNVTSGFECWEEIQQPVSNVVLIHPAEGICITADNYLARVSMFAELYDFYICILFFVFLSSIIKLICSPFPVCPIQGLHRPYREPHLEHGPPRQGRPGRDPRPVPFVHENPRDQAAAGAPSLHAASAATPDPDLKEQVGSGAGRKQRESFSKSTEHVVYKIYHLKAAPMCNHQGLPPSSSVLVWVGGAWPQGQGGMR